MSNPFSHPHRRVAHARRHIVSLRQHCKAYEASAVVLTVIEVDAKTGNLVHMAKLKEPLPNELIDDAVTAVESLRAALDQAGHAASAACGVTKLETTAFPFGEDEKLLQVPPKKLGRSKDLPAPILELFLSYKPFRTGSYRLWALNELARSKHRTLSPTIFGSQQAVIDHLQTRGGTLLKFKWPPKWDPDTQAAVFAVSDPSCTYSYSLSLKVLVALGGHVAFAKFAASDVLGAIADDVAEIVAATENKVREMGFL